MSGDITHIIYDELVRIAGLNVAFVIRGYEDFKHESRPGTIKKDKLGGVSYLHSIRPLHLDRLFQVDQCVPSLVILPA